VDGRPARQRGLGLALVAQIVTRHGGVCTRNRALDAGMLVVRVPLPRRARRHDSGEVEDR
ncbi:ATP-binding protein, partial [Rhodococcus hoagii]|nr:ATP-binding protein [Prescottella equi]